MIRIPQNTTIVGEIRCDGNMEVSGHIEGNSDIKGLLIITKECIWIGKAVADTVIVEGIVEGGIVARKKLEIKPSARITGSVTSPSILISKSADLDCEIHMAPNKQAIDLQSHKKQKQLILPEFNINKKLGEQKEKVKNFVKIG